MHKITRGEGDTPKDYIGLQEGVHLVQPLHRQSIKENPDFTGENQFFELKFKQFLSLDKIID